MSNYESYVILHLYKEEKKTTTSYFMDMKHRKYKLQQYLAQNQ